nr:unnamed protein product [Fasciola hepatica]
MTVQCAVDQSLYNRFERCQHNPKYLGSAEHVHQALVKICQNECKTQPNLLILIDTVESFICCAINQSLDCCGTRFACFTPPHGPVTWHRFLTVSTSVCPLVY